MSIITTPSIYTVINKNNATGVYSSLPNSYITNLIYNPSNRPSNPVKGEQYYDSTDNLLYFWDGTTWVSGGGGGSLPPGIYYGDYLYWNGSGYVVGNNNVNLGSNSGEKAQGLYNVAIGYQAGFTGGFSSQDPYASTATGSSVAIGYYSGYEQACNSIAIGNSAGYYQGFNNISIGSSAGYYQPEINNIAIGIAAGAYNQGTGGSQYSVGGNSIAIGSSVGNNLQGYESVAIGFYAGEIKQGYNSIAIGTNTANTSQGNTSIAIGVNAGQTNQDDYSVAIGRNTASSSQGYDSIAIGSFSGNTSQGNVNVALGYYAGYNLQEDYSVAIGNAAGHNNQHQRSIAIGNNAGRIIQQYSAIAIGDNAGYNNQQDNCIAIGTLAGNVNQGVTGDPINGQAIAIGYRAAEDSQGDQAIAIGTRSGNVNQHDYGIAIGHYAGNSNQSTGGVAIGVGAGSSQQGEYSVALGYNAGSSNQPSQSIIINASPTGLEASTGGLFINPIRGGSSSQVLFYNPLSKEITYSTGGSIGLQGYQGDVGTNGISGGLTLFLDTDGSATGSLLTIPNQTTGTSISSGNQTNTTINIARFITPTGTLQSNVILGGLWDMNLYASSANSYYWFNVAYVDSDGISNKIVIATGSSSDATLISTDIAPYLNSIYVPSTTLPDISKRIVVDVFLQTIGTSINTNLYFRNGTLSHLHTTLLAVSQGISNIGKDTQVLFNYQGTSTGSNNLTYTGGNLILSTGNVGIGTTNPTYLLHVNGNISPYTINRGNPGKNNTLLLDSFNTTHFYNINASTGFIDISTQMLENAVYEVNFTCIGASANNNDFNLYPNFNTSFGATTFYSVYKNISGTGSLSYQTTNNASMYFDFVNGNYGWDPVGKITIYNIRSGKKILLDSGDTTSSISGTSYWTSGSGFSSSSLSSIVYDTSTQWNNIGRLTFANQTFSNWNVWVKRIA